ncbi:MAG TPA: response regulator transcription factor [Puia sp.]|jgi:DNA-binding NarL/FixJ family response regulator|nr:response regulator transcription factor [Puia sp.]
MITVFIIDDHQMIIEGIHSLLLNEKDIQWMGSAKLPAELMNVLKTRTPDVLLMDINLPEKSGLDLCKEVKAQYPEINIVGLSTSFQASVIRKMRENGAAGYLLKDASKQEIVTALHEVSQGREYVSFSVAQVLKQKTPADQLPVLTKREKEVLELIADGLTNQEIATRLFLNCTTVDSHRKNMLTKFDAKNTAALVRIAVSNHLI